MSTSNPPPSFCPGPYFFSHRISPCLFNLTSASILLLFIVLAGSGWYFDLLSRHAAHRQRRRASGDRGVRRRLLDEGGEANGDDEEDEEAPSSDVPIRPAAPSFDAASSSPLSTAARVFSTIALLTFLLDLAVDLYHVSHPEIPTSVSRNVTARTTADVLASFAWLIETAFAFFVATLGMGDAGFGREGSPKVPFVLQQFWGLALVLETVELYQWAINIADPLLGIGGVVHPLDSSIDAAHFVLFGFRYVAIATLVVFAIVHRATAARNRRGADLESGRNVSDAAAPKSFGWSESIRKCKKLLPFLWPRPRRLQLLVVGCFILLALGRAVNLLVPWQYREIVNDLTPNGETDPEKRRPFFAYGAIFLYVFFRFLQGGVGLLSSLQYFLWIPVGQYTTREISVRMLEHLHSLSLQFHINRKTGEILRVMDRGTASIGSLLSYLAFNILPVFVDIGLAVVFTAWIFDWAIGLIVFTTMALYIACTIWITEWRTKFRREMNDLDAASRARAVDSLLNFETVKYYNNEEWEVREYEKSILLYQVADWKSNASLNVLNTAQNVVITIGLMVGLLLVAKRVADGELLVGDFVLFLTYLLQLYQPLNWFGTYYRVIQQNFIDMEKMLDLFEDHKGLDDAPNAKELEIKEGGRITFDKVHFAYDARQAALRGVSFEVPAGKTVALVGPSGGGKSTIFRLLFRFYDATDGSVSIDGQNVSRVTQKSLRQHIGVVPQDTVLFNETIRYNIRYGRVDATDAEVEAAAKAAHIHDRILSFPDGYDTKVGERGLRLSGGEKQRIAIARTLLKNPSIILLDEATSALDNTTERLIQESIKTLSSNRTTLVIAHRLSTIVDADIILVMKDGTIVERGTHDELLAKGEEMARKRGERKGSVVGESGEGTYYGMWMRQLGDESASSPVGSVVNGGNAAVGPSVGGAGASDGGFHGHGFSGFHGQSQPSQQGQGRGQTDLKGRKRNHP
ncbi:Homocysteine S-methyltransferase 1 [Borealophlyctis nickersoniae]|nr:Homocysteine S-methyltransferase 1 [Borealophlyctis nickersoniae]